MANQIAARKSRGHLSFVASGFSIAPFTFVDGRAQVGPGADVVVISGAIAAKVSLLLGANTCTR
jgi:hypothetical protein